MKIKNLEGADRELVVVALQALLRERRSAYNTVMTTCSINGKPFPSEDLFGLE